MKISSNHVFWALQLNYETRVLIKIFELSYEKRAGPANRDLALFSWDLGKTGCFFLIWQLQPG